MAVGQDYQIPLGQTLGVCLKRVAGDQTTISARLVKLSRMSAELVVYTPVEEDESIQLRLRRTSDLELAVAARISVVRRTDSGEWLAYCDFEEMVTHQVIADLLNAGLLESCHEQDRRLPLPASLQWESDSTMVAVILKNFNTAGFCVISPRGADEGARLRLVVEKPSGQRLLVNAVANWQIETPGGSFQLGCAFAGTRDYFKLRSFLFIPLPSFEEPRPVFRCLSHLSQVGTVAVLCCNYLHLV